ncbi:class I SAM-dependent methyltransferase [Symbioplanes lichenis]|uniref:class I SAM-dependent methyltransferase n=1 Tax=Symbioplanes lichenis TaxID=1629072 RepID=UPI002739B5D3|nr:class I SAM-dependent methyltransferase [Actinoplanes lichenis]
MSHARVSRSGSDLSRHRQVAEGFGADPDRYDRTRPRYPDALVRRVAGDRAGLDVVDVGCGTGIAARQFQAAGCTVLGVEPDPRMAEVARRRGLVVEMSAFETWDPAGRSFDAVVAGQTWHWLDAVAGARKAAQVLRPGGRLAVFWNAEVPPPDALRAFGEVYRRMLPGSLVARQWTNDSLAGYAELGRKAADGMERSGGFGPPEETRDDWERTYSRDEWLDQLPTHGDHSQFPVALVREVQAAVGAVIDRLGGSFTMGYATVGISAVRTSS